MNMKKSIYLILSLILVSCSSNEIDFEYAPPIEDVDFQWNLTEMLIDPGNGSGEFEPTDLDIQLSFVDNQTVKANGLLCGFNETYNILTGTYSEADSIIITDCPMFNRSFWVSRRDSILILNSLNCIEPCSAKFVKID